MSLRTSASERGASLVAFTLILTFVMLPLLGLAIDVSIQYWIKARLSSAVDSAALAAARSLNIGNTISSQIVNAQTVGRQYFAANFPPGTLGTTVFGGQQVSNSVSINIPNPVNNYITVNATAQVVAPLYFLQLLRVSSGVITASSQTTRRNANIMLVLDRSGSMNNASNSCAALVASVESFTNQFVDGRDELGLITFANSANVDYQPTLYFKSGGTPINSTINPLLCGGATSTAQAMTIAYNSIKTINQPGSLNVILLFTDGKPNAIVAHYPIKLLPDSRYDWANTGNVVTVGPSSCNTSLLSDLSGGFTNFINTGADTGPTGGVYDVSTIVPINVAYPNPSAINAPGCSFTQNGVLSGRQDVAYVPTQDAYGNLTTGYKPSITFTSNYFGQIRPDSPAAIINASMNAVDFIAQKIRSDTTYNIVTYTIGLAGNEPTPMDQDFLERIANDPRASNYNSSQPQGRFALATDNASLADAFNAIASQILRLSK